MNNSSEFLVTIYFSKNFVIIPFHFISIMVTIFSVDEQIILGTYE